METWAFRGLLFPTRHQVKNIETPALDGTKHPAVQKQTHLSFSSVAPWLRGAKVLSLLLVFTPEATKPLPHRPPMSCRRRYRHHLPSSVTSCPGHVPYGAPRGFSSIHPAAAE